MVAIAKFALFAATASAGLLGRDYNKVYSDLQTINSDTVTLGNDVAAYTGGTNGVATVQNDESKLDSDIQQATTDAKNTPTVTSAQANNVINYISGTLTPNIKTTLNNLVGKKSQFVAAGLGGVVLSDLKTLKSDTDALASALIAKTPTSQTAAASSAQSSIDALFNSAIKAYS